MMMKKTQIKSITNLNYRMSDTSKLYEIYVDDGDNVDVVDHGDIHSGYHGDDSLATM